RLELIHSFCEDIPLDSGSIDSVVINDTFPHFNDREIALQEIRRVLKKAGSLYLIHTSSSKKVNRTHKDIGEPVKKDLLPSVNNLVSILENLNFQVNTARDTENHLFIKARILKD
ncbi:MAG: class I SAM-dependent methyltransferase, partial [Candidatus Marinimicrobia bacterium]|nr:class I SAM-dependent methyltransferase [Candidatus Neomarinimicrobiota bacterium]